MTWSIKLTRRLRNAVLPVKPLRCVGRNKRLNDRRTNNTNRIITYLIDTVFFLLEFFSESLRREERDSIQVFLNTHCDIWNLLDLMTVLTAAGCGCRNHKVFVGIFTSQIDTVNDNGLAQAWKRIFPQSHKQGMTSPGILSLKNHCEL